jgi:hypothetical protein
METGVSGGYLGNKGGKSLKEKHIMSGTRNTTPPTNEETVYHIFDRVIDCLLEHCPTYQDLLIKQSCVIDVFVCSIEKALKEYPQYKLNCFAQAMTFVLGRTSFTCQPKYQLILSFFLLAITRVRLQQETNPTEPTPYTKMLVVHVKRTPAETKAPRDVTSADQRQHEEHRERIENIMHMLVNHMEKTQKHINNESIHIQHY